MVRRSFRSGRTEHQYGKKRSTIIIVERKKKELKKNNVYNVQKFESDCVVHQGWNVARHQMDQRFGHCFGRWLFHCGAEPEVNQGQPSILIHQQVAWVRIGMKHACVVVG